MRCGDCVVIGVGFGLEDVWKIVDPQHVGGGGHERVLLRPNTGNLSPRIGWDVEGFGPRVSEQIDARCC